MMNTRLRQSDMLDMSNVLADASNLKTAKLKQQAAEINQDQALAEAETYGNFIAKDNPSAAVAPVDTNKDGVISPKEKRQAAIKTGFKMGALNEIEKIRNRRADRARAEQRRARAEADRARAKLSKEARIAAIAKAMETAGYSPEEVELAKVAGLRTVKTLDTMKKAKNKVNYEATKERINLTGNLLGGVIKLKQQGMRDEEIDTIYKAEVAKLPPGMRSEMPQTVLDESGKINTPKLHASLTMLSEILKIDEDTEKKPRTYGQSDTRAEKAYRGVKEYAQSEFAKKDKFTGEKEVDEKEAGRLQREVEVEIDKILDKDKRIRPATARKKAIDIVERRRKSKAKTPEPSKTKKPMIPESEWGKYKIGKKYQDSKGNVATYIGEGVFE